MEEDDKGKEYETLGRRGRKEKGRLGEDKKWREEREKKEKGD